MSKIVAIEDFAPEVEPSRQAVELDVLCLADVKPKPITWLWPNWIAIGKVHCLAGDGGRGKSTVLCDIAARTSRGEAWPDGAQATKSGSVITLAAEDDVEDTLAPRLLAVGADMNRIFTVRSARNPDQSRRSFSLQVDLVRLEALVTERGDVRLVIIDPISSYLGKVDSHKNAEVRAVLEPLGELAARLGIAVICNNHFSKAGGTANSRIIGSVAFVNQARATFIVTPDAEDDSRLLLVPSKMNIAPMKHGLAYRLEGTLIETDGQTILTSRVAWELQPVTITADQALAALAGGAEERSAVAEAQDFLTNLLTGGPMPQKHIKEAAEGSGIAWRTIQRAKKRLCIEGAKDGMGGGWSWSLPKSADNAEECQPKKMASFGSNGALRCNGVAFCQYDDGLEIPEFLRRIG